MTSYKSDFLRVMRERGYIHQCSNDEALDTKASTGIVTAYVGFDCTAASLHVGNLLGIMMLRKLQQTGHKPVVLIGGGTTRVGDPSGKDDTRKLLNDEQIEQNISGIRQVFEKFLTFGDGPTDAIMVNNADWLLKLNYIEFLRDYGPHFTINRMMTFESVKQRLDREQPLTFLEFNYMIFQAYDFLELKRQNGCTLQMGGSDQWGNIINGIELGRRVDGAELYALTTALLTTSSGAKMGKTAKGAVWLNEDMLSPYDYWQFWRNTEDSDVGRFLRLFTELPLAEIEELEKLEGADLNEAKKLLATTACAMAHGKEKALEASDTALKTFEHGTMASGLPTVEISAADLNNGLGLLTAMVTAGLANSNGEARRHIKGGAVKINDVKAENEKVQLGGGDITDEGVIKLSVGKKRHVLLKAI
ncbi:MAG: tyrosine--tRNA ligase [bacterium]|nr:tyrosine--tRNA ligase [bacterium]